MFRPCSEWSTVARAVTDGYGAWTIRICRPSYHALIDGDRIQPGMPCRTEAIVKGDTQEYCIAAASILAKVTRDRIMTHYHEQYPRFNFLQ